MRVFCHTISPYRGVGGRMSRSPGRQGCRSVAPRRSRRRLRELAGFGNGAAGGRGMRTTDNGRRTTDGGRRTGVRAGVWFWQMRGREERRGRSILPARDAVRYFAPKATDVRFRKACKNSYFSKFVFFLLTLLYIVIKMSIF